MFSHFQHKIKTRSILLHLMRRYTKNTPVNKIRLQSHPITATTFCFSLTTLFICSFCPFEPAGKLHYNSNKDKRGQSMVRDSFCPVSNSAIFRENHLQTVLSYPDQFYFSSVPVCAFYFPAFLLSCYCNSFCFLDAYLL